MSETPSDLASVTAALDRLRAEIGGLAQRVTVLEQNAAAVVVDDDLLMVISASIAAFLGEKPRIRQIRLVGSSNWSQQGRAVIHASHNLTYWGRSPTGLPDASRGLPGR